MLRTIAVLHLILHIRIKGGGAEEGYMKCTGERVGRRAKAEGKLLGLDKTVT